MFSLRVVDQFVKRVIILYYFHYELIDQMMQETINKKLVSPIDHRVQRHNGSISLSSQLHGMIVVNQLNVTTEPQQCVGESDVSLAALDQIAGHQTLAHTLPPVSH